MFDIYIGIDYSGASLPNKALRNLQVYMATKNSSAKKIAPLNSNKINWSRVDAAHWLIDQLHNEKRCLVGIDHCFSFPLSFMQNHNIKTWDGFLNQFCKKIKTTEITVKQALDENPSFKGNKTELRLCETWTSSAKSVFEFKNIGVAHSSYAGIPWLHFIRNERKKRVHFWPFDGWDIGNKKSVIVEVYPSIFNKRYEYDWKTGDERDAFSIACWLKEKDRNGFLDQYFQPPLTDEEKRIAKLEGWILGIL